MLRLTSLLGLFALLVFGCALSNNRRCFPWRTVIWGLALRAMIAGLLACYLFTCVVGILL